MNSQSLNWFVQNRNRVAAVCIVALLLGSAVHAKPVDDAVRLQDAFREVAGKAFPAVVVITNKQVVRQQPMYYQLPPEFQYFFGIPMQPQQQQRDTGRGTPVPAGKGSGVMVRDTGLIVTNYHVIRDADALEVRLHDGRVFDNFRDKDAVKVVGTDEETDLAVLQIGGGELRDLPTLAFADSTSVMVGDWAIAVGAPFNLDYSVTVGVVSQKGRYDVNVNTYENYIQTDASINPGNSGGPLLNIRGEIIGINDFIMTGGPGSRGNIGLGFAIDSNLVQQVLSSIEEHGEVVRPWLGIAMQQMTEELRQQFGVEQGVLISEVTAGEPAEKAGLEAGDVILQVGEKGVRTPHDVQLAVLAYKPGDDIPFRIDRRGKEQTITVTARRKGGARTSTIASKDEMLNRLGLALEENDEGVVVVGVVGGSAADVAQFRRGDRIIEVNRTPVKTVQDVLDALNRGDKGSAVFYVDRRGHRFFAVINMSNDR
jgi:Do/DeqQ family serine protease